jgi:hypothetical protein
MKAAGLPGAAAEADIAYTTRNGVQFYELTFFEEYVADNYARAPFDLRSAFIHEAAHEAQDEGILHPASLGCPTEITHARYDVPITPDLALAKLCIEPQAIVMQGYFDIFLTSQHSSQSVRSRDHNYGNPSLAKANYIRHAVETVLPSAAETRAELVRKGDQWNRNFNATFHLSASGEDGQNPVNLQPVDPYTLPAQVPALQH